MFVLSWEEEGELEVLGQYSCSFVLVSIWIVGEKWSDGSLAKEICLGVTGGVEWVEWIRRVFREWPGGLAKEPFMVEDSHQWREGYITPL